LSGELRVRSQEWGVKSEEQGVGREKRGGMNKITRKGALWNS